MKITLLGAGAWGTALAIAFAGKHAVTLWSRETDVAEDLRLNRENHRFFPGYRLPDAVVVFTDFAAAVADAELLVVATPIAGLRPTVEHLKALGCKTPVLWVCKGFEAGSGKLPHQVVGEALGKDALCGALSGPSFAEEVAAGQPTAGVAGCQRRGLRPRGSTPVAQRPFAYLTPTMTWSASRSAVRSRMCWPLPLACVTALVSVRTRVLR